MPPVTKIKKEPENGETNIPPAQPDVPDARPELQVQNIWMDPRSDQIESKLMEIGVLFVDEDVLYALRNLKDLDKNMWQSGVLYDSNVSNSCQQSRCGRSLFMDFGCGDNNGVQPVDVTTPISGNASTIKQESRERQMFNSPPPPGRVFSGMK